MLTCGIVGGGCDFEKYLYTAIATGELTRKESIKWLIYVDDWFVVIPEYPIMMKRLRARFPKANIVEISSKSLTDKNRAGFRHGANLDYLTSFFETDYCMILDQDIAFLYRGWDTLLLSELNEHTIAIGTEAPDELLWKNTPFIHALMYDRQIFQDLKINFLKDHKSNDKYERIHWENAAIWGKKEGTIYKENGYKIPLIINQNNHFDTKVLKPLIEADLTEWYYSKEGVLILSHKKASRKKKDGKDETSGRV